MGITDQLLPAQFPTKLEKSEMGIDGLWSHFVCLHTMGASKQAPPLWGYEDMIYIQGRPKVGFYLLGGFVFINDDQDLYRSSVGFIEGLLLIFIPFLFVVSKPSDAFWSCTPVWCSTEGKEGAVRSRFSWCTWLFWPRRLMTINLGDHS